MVLHSFFNSVPYNIYKKIFFALVCDQKRIHVHNVIPHYQCFEQALMTKNGTVSSDHAYLIVLTRQIYHMTVTCRDIDASEFARIYCAVMTAMAGSERLHCVHLLLLSSVSLLLPATVLGEPCPADACPDLSSHDIDLSPLRG